eukprot:5750929-Pyramimonas_sp.AAC.3
MRGLPAVRGSSAPARARPGRWAARCTGSWRECSADEMAAVVEWLRGDAGREWWTRALPGERVVCRVSDDDVDH